MAVRFEHQLQIVRTFRRRHRDPARPAHREVLLFLEAEHFGVEAQRLVLIVNKNAVQSNSHESPRRWFTQASSIAQALRKVFSKIAIASAPPIHSRQLGGWGVQSGT